MIPFEKNSLILAPMAGVTDSAFRQICKKYGADITVCEMVSSKGIYYNDNKSKSLLEFTKAEQPIIMQIFGHEPEPIKKATEFITNNYSPIAIDINMGCPAPKIFNNGDGSALMKTPDVAYSVIKAVKQNTNLPVSVKFRSGIDKSSITAVDFAKMCESADADFITVHGRTREQFYNGESDIEIIKSVVDNVNIPVIANGDITSKAVANKVLDYTGAHSLMVGRASLGNPLIFNQIKGIDCNVNIFDVAIEHLKLLINSKPEIIAVKEFRKHLLWYFKGIKNATDFKRNASSVNTVTECINLLNAAKEIE